MGSIGAGGGTSGCGNEDSAASKIKASA